MSADPPDRQKYAPLAEFVKSQAKDSFGVILMVIEKTDKTNERGEVGVRMHCHVCVDTEVKESVPSMLLDLAEKIHHEQRVEQITECIRGLREYTSDAKGE